MAESIEVRSKAASGRVAKRIEVPSNDAGRAGAIGSAVVLPYQLPTKRRYQGNVTCALVVLSQYQCNFTSAGPQSRLSNSAWAGAWRAETYLRVR